VNGPNDIFVERFGKIFAVDARFTSDTHLRRTIDKIVNRIGRRIDESSPMVDARLADGSRVNAVIAPIALDGSILTIRKFSQDPFTDADLIAFGTLSVQARDFLRACILGRRNVVISGGTGSGKTTLLQLHPRR
jgi:pilus assembly protein CpaF